MRNFVFIVLGLGLYVYIVSSDPNGFLISKAKNICSECYLKIKQMNLKVEVNKWPNKKTTFLLNDFNSSKNQMKAKEKEQMLRRFR